MLTGTGQLLPRIEWQRPQWRLLGYTGLRAGKIVSLLLLSAVIGVLFWVQFDEAFFVYREDVRFTGLGYLGQDELYTASGLDSWNVLWVQPTATRRRLLEHPYVADARVQVRLPANVEIAVTEARPVAVWVTGPGELWLLEDGVALSMRGATPEHLPRLVDPEQEATALGKPSGQAIRRDVLEAFLSLSRNVPGLTTVHFNRSPGLNFRLPGTTFWVYWGDGRYTDIKLYNLEILGRRLQNDGKRDQIIDVRSPTRPSVRGR